MAAMSDQLFPRLVTFAIANPGSTFADVLAGANGLGIASADATAFLTRFGQALVDFGYLDELSWPAFRDRVNALGETRAMAGVEVIQRFMRGDPSVQLIDARERRVELASSVTTLEASVSFAETQIETDPDANRVALFEIARNHLQGQLHGQRQILESVDVAISQLEATLGIV